jgi:uncharacterized OsmC-like protein
MTRGSIVRRRHTELRAQYRQVPEKAKILKRARTATGFVSPRDPFHGRVIPEKLGEAGASYAVVWHFGVDRAVGGEHDAPNPGEMLCGALAACADASVRMMAGLLDVELMALEVDVTGELDVRGTLGLEPSVRVGFRRFDMVIRLRPAAGTPTQRVERLVSAAERACVVLDTLRGGVPVDLVVDASSSAPDGSSRSRRK